MFTNTYEPLVMLFEINSKIYLYICILSSNVLFLQYFKFQFHSVLECWENREGRKKNYAIKVIRFFFVPHIYFVYIYIYTISYIDRLNFQSSQSHLARLQFTLRTYKKSQIPKLIEWRREEKIVKKYLDPIILFYILCINFVDYLFFSCSIFYRIYRNRRIKCSKKNLYIYFTVLDQKSFITFKFIITQKRSAIINSKSFSSFSNLKNILSQKRIIDQIIVNFF